SWGAEIARRSNSSTVGTKSIGMGATSSCFGTWPEDEMTAPMLGLLYWPFGSNCLVQCDSLGLSHPHFGATPRLAELVFVIHISVTGRRLFHEPQGIPKRGHSFWRGRTPRPNSVRPGQSDCLKSAVQGWLCRARHHSRTWNGEARGI